MRRSSPRSGLVRLVDPSMSTTTIERCTGPAWGTAFEEGTTVSRTLMMSPPFLWQSAATGLIVFKGQDWPDLLTQFVARRFQMPPYGGLRYTEHPGDLPGRQSI